MSKTCDGWTLKRISDLHSGIWNTVWGQCRLVLRVQSVKLNGLAVRGSSCCWIGGAYAQSFMKVRTTGIAAALVTRLPDKAWLREWVRIHLRCQRHQPGLGTSNDLRAAPGEPTGGLVCSLQAQLSAGCNRNRDTLPLAVARRSTTCVSQSV